LVRVAFLAPILASALLLITAIPARASGYKNFAVSVYVRAGEVARMKDPAWLESRWKELTDGLRVDKVYLETYRDGTMPDQEAVDSAKRFFQAKGVKTAGGIATVLRGWPWFVTFCFTNPEHRKKLQEVVEFTARNFDEVILDDFFFNNTKALSDIQAKGSRSWTRFRLDLMAEVSRDLVVGPAKRVNPRVKMVIKYPNWYDHFQYLGYNLEDEPRIFDGVYTGTETRDPIHTDQHLQQYLGYDLMRYLENIKPGGNGGGWVDPYGWRDKERYAEQLSLTLFAKAREVTLFNFADLLEPMRATPQSPVHGTMTAFAGNLFDSIDGFIGQLGRPVGVKSYKPLHSSGEDYLHDFIGMLGIPLELVPTFPVDAPTVLLTESAKYDPLLVDRIKKQLQDGKNVVITSGLLNVLRSWGLDDVVELRTGAERAAVREFRVGRGKTVHVDADIMIPEIAYPTNDAWELVTSVSQGVGYPILLKDDYARGVLYVWTIPDNFGDLYRLPPEVLDEVRRVVAGDLAARLEGPSQVALFAYDNDKWIVESFAPPGGKSVDVNLVLGPKVTRLLDVVSGKHVPGSAREDKMVYALTLAPSSFRVLAAEAP
jgi:hypothetical protein